MLELILERKNSITVSKILGYLAREVIEQISKYRYKRYI